MSREQTRLCSKSFKDRHLADKDQRAVIRHLNTMDKVPLRRDRPGKRFEAVFGGAGRFSDGDLCGSFGAQVPGGDLRGPWRVSTLYNGLFPFARRLARTDQNRSLTLVVNSAERYVRDGNGLLRTELALWDVPLVSFCGLTFPTENVKRLLPRLPKSLWCFNRYHWTDRLSRSPQASAGVLRMKLDGNRCLSVFTGSALGFTCASGFGFRAGKRRYKRSRSPVLRLGRFGADSPWSTSPFPLRSVATPRRKPRRRL